MAETVINNLIKKTLKIFDERYFIDDKVNKAKVIQDIENYNISLLQSFLENEELKKYFTIEINGDIIFQTNKLIELFETDEFWKDSFTKYSKKIGLNVNNKFIDETQDIVLDFPYKDTILKANMSKENMDKEDLKADEPFLNEIIAREEIDVMLDKKILVNVKKFSENGVNKVDTFNEKENLIIKGNNLLALHSIKKRYFEKVKTIFIDPPYFFNSNKPDDTFAYNSNFKLSTWLLFLKNRLEIAKELLKEDGLIFITISSEGAHYLKVLIDEIFGRENFIADITWQSRKSVSNDSLVSVASNHLLIYAKNIHNIDKNKFKLALDLDNFKFDDNDGRGKYKVEPFDAPKIRKNLEYPIKNPNTGKIYYPPKGRHWRTTQSEFEKMLREDRIRFGSKGTSKPQLKVYLSEAKELKKGKTSTTIWKDLELDSILWEEAGTTTNGTQHQQKLFGEIVFENPKPEGLISRAIELSTEKDDLVLDFFMGSATTPAVAHKMNRQYIGIEQMDYINTVSIPRLKKVIDGEPYGVSELVNWTGGGSFIYAELMEKNVGFIKSVQNAKTQNELYTIFEYMCEEAEINFKVDLEMLKETIYQSSFNEQKNLLLRIIEKNQLYYNYSEIDDINVNDLISDSDYSFNKSFYNEVNNEDEKK